MDNNNVLKQKLIEMLGQEHCFWSFDMSKPQEVPDSILIEKTLIYLDLEQIDMLFKIYSYRLVKSVWLDRLVPQEDYLYSLNRFYAWYYFKAKRPDAYIKTMATRHLNKQIS